MKSFNLALPKWCAVASMVLMTTCWASSNTYADGPLDLPTADGIAPGDVIISDFFNGWLKFEPRTNQLYSLPWDGRFSFDQFAFDVDGAILSLDFRSLQRIHPVTGAATPLDPLLRVRAHDFGVAANGDLILAQIASHSRIEGNVWSGGHDGGLFRYSRQTGQLTRFAKPEHFSPHGVAMGPTGEVYIDEFFRGLQQVDFTAGTLLDLDGTPSRELIWDMATFPNGDLAVLTVFDGIRRLNPITKEDSLIVDIRSFARTVCVDDDGDLWVGGSGLYFVDGLTGEYSLKVSKPFFSPTAIAVVPADWTPPPIPEPSSLTLAALAILVGANRPTCLRRCQRSSRRCC